jgi:serine/threonine-protein kinase
MTSPPDPTRTTDRSADTPTPGTVDTPPAGGDLDVTPLPAGDRYQVVRLHARGGLGEVHLAEDAALHRPVALKTIQDEYATDPAARRRFLREAEVTARLQHPGIVPVYGLGTDAAGRPAYVMRFIEGEPLSEAARRFHAAGARFDSLEFRQLLQHFVAACNAVAYAHSRGVVHRDLKPANVMLGRFGETLVVDWGLARTVDRPEGEAPAGEATVRAAVDSDGQHTQMGAVVGTPAYMAPEQAAGRWDLLGPPADVYGLGAVLYTLLTGRPPIDGDIWPAMQQKIQRGDFPTPRQVHPAAPRALEAVCRKAMAPDPAGRYATALDLAADVQRWLADEPVAAHREPLSARAWRWVKRHRTLVSSAAALGLTAAVGLAAGLVAVSREQAATAKERDDKELALRAEAAARADAERQRDEAEKQKRRTRQALDDMTSQESLEWLTTQKQLLPPQRAFLERALTYYREFAAQAGIDRERELSEAQAQFRVAHILHSLGQTAAAEPAYGRAVELWARLAAADPAYRNELARVHNNRAVLLSGLGRGTEAEAAFRAAVAVREKLVAENPAVPAYRSDLARGQFNLGVLYNGRGRWAEAEAAFRTALGLREQLATEYPDEPKFRGELAATHDALGAVLSMLGKLAEAEAAHWAALTVQERLADQFPAVPEYRWELGRTRFNLGLSLLDQGRFPEAEAEYRAALAVRERLAAEHPGVPTYRSELAASHYSLGNVLRSMGRAAEAEATIQSARSAYEKLAAENPRVPEYPQELARTLGALGNLLGARGQLPAAEAAFRAAVTLREKLVADHPGVVPYAIDLAASYRDFGTLTRNRNEPTAAVDWYAKAITTAEPIFRAEPRLGPARASLRYSHRDRARALVQLGRPAEAVADWERALALEDGPGRPALQLGRADALARAGDVARARAAADELAVAPGLNPEQTYDLACVYALAAATLPPADADAAAARAVELLRRAIAAGFPGRAQLLKDDDLAALRPRADFAALLWDIADEVRTGGAGR